MQDKHPVLVPSLSLSTLLVLGGALVRLGPGDLRKDLKRTVGHHKTAPKLPAIAEAGKPQVVAAYGKLPLSFEVNQGQADPQVRFLSRGQGYSLFLTPTEIVSR